MSFSLDTPTTQTLKAEAKALRAEREEAGAPITHGAALEAIAHQHGYRDWNTAAAALPDRITTPAQVGQRIKGSYLGNTFTGMVVGMQMLDPQHYKVSVQFDQPVNVSKSKLFDMYRHRVMATLDARGVSASRTSDGEPHMRLQRA